MARHWNYRIVSVSDENDTIYYIREVHYDDGMIIAISEDASVVLSETRSGIADTLELMRVALSKPTISWTKVSACKFPCLPESIEE